MIWPDVSPTVQKSHLFQHKFCNILEGFARNKWLKINRQQCSFHRDVTSNREAKNGNMNNGVKNTLQHYSSMVWSPSFLKYHGQNLASVNTYNENQPSYCFSFVLKGCVSAARRVSSASSLV